MEIKQERRSHSPDRRKDRRRSKERNKRDQRSRSPQQRNRSPQERNRSPQQRNRNQEQKNSRWSKEDTRWSREERKQPEMTGGNQEGIQANSGGGALAGGVKEEEEGVEKEGVNMALSGALTQDTNTFNGIVIKYSEPPEARKPKRRWRFYVFKGDEVMPTLHLHRQSAFLMGRDRKVCDLPIDHPSCSKQHAAFQYRLVQRRKDDGLEANRVLPYIIDLGSANGTYLNNKKIDPQRYVELKEKDVLKFGYSSREYVLLHENSEDQE